MFSMLLIDFVDGIHRFLDVFLLFCLFDSSMGIHGVHQLFSWFSWMFFIRVVGFSMV